MFDSFDQASLDLIIELQLQDAQNLIKGKHRAGETPDGELAAELFKLELESLASFHVDQAMSRSLAHAILTDGEAIQSLVEEEEQAVRDRELAINGEASTQGPGTADPDTAIEDDMVKKLVALYVGEDDHSGTAAASSSKQAARPSTSTAAIEKRRCVACMTDVPYFETSALNDESLFPPRCCSQPIPLGLNQIFLPARLAGQYQAKELEYSTKNRTYCHRATCSTFIPTPFIRGEIATCVKCQSKTCTICKGSSHDGDCPEDVATMDLLNVAAQKGWQRCYSCRRMVDLEVGCNHISELIRRDPSFVKTD
ncbi:ibr finger domain containing protein [Metarhizium robertsii ARSEF 23]|uniref:Ibr finger domain containing protein n=1 Tax=Metarhizium robertsii (strain ARSEF 23 / ATCC MYA-3075) TaxID=655844 RepID=E9ENT6_METRA|nr:ibr finger domain containing protein [Metarhizium robertsii ARSEF 23]EFZ02206.2 ibr finger domain containing protein [Metarhizium robertsii ARSEF 23]